MEMILQKLPKNVTSSALKGASSSAVGTVVAEGTIIALAVAPIPLVAKVAIGVWFTC